MQLEKRQLDKEESVQLFQTINDSLSIQDTDNLSVKMRTIQTLWCDVSRHVSTTMKSLITACTISRSYEPNFNKISKWISDTNAELEIMKSLSFDAHPLNEIQMKVDVCYWVYYNLIMCNMSICHRIN